MRKKTHEEFIQEVFELVGNDYKVVSKYEKASKHVEMEHCICNYKYEVNPNNFLKGHGKCPMCTKNTKKKTTEVFKKQVYDLVENEYIILGEYVGDGIKIQMKHIICSHEFYMIPSGFLQGSRCPKCGLKKRTSKRTKTHKQFIKEVDNVWLEEYSIINTYSGSKNKVKIKHIICGLAYETLPGNILKGHGCPHCAKKNSGSYRKKTQENFVKEVFELVKNEYSVLGKYKNTNTHIRMKHNKCDHEYEVTPSNFLRGCRCPKCNASKGEKEISEWLDKNIICYEPQKEFKGLKGLGGLPLKFDFAIFNNENKLKFLIEYDGEFHFKKLYENDNYETIVEHDKRKNQYCKDNNISLYRIPYWKKDNIEEILSKLINNESVEVDKTSFLVV